MQNLKKAVLATAFVVSGLAFGAVMPVSAQTQVCVPGAYNICPPDTDITIGSMHITDGMIVGLIVVYAVGMILLINGSVLTNKLKSLKASK